MSNIRFQISRGCYFKWLNKTWWVIVHWKAIERSNKMDFSITLCELDTSLQSCIKILVAFLVVSWNIVVCGHHAFLHWELLLSLHIKLCVQHSCFSYTACWRDAGNKDLWIVVLGTSYTLNYGAWMQAHYNPHYYYHQTNKILVVSYHDCNLGSSNLQCSELEHAKCQSPHTHTSGYLSDYKYSQSNWWCNASSEFIWAIYCSNHFTVLWWGNIWLYSILLDEWYCWNLPGFWERYCSLLDEQMYFILIIILHPILWM